MWGALGCHFSFICRATFRASWKDNHHVLVFLLLLTRDLFPVSLCPHRRTPLSFHFFNTHNILVFLSCRVMAWDRFFKRKLRNIQFKSWRSSWCVFRCKDYNRKKEQLWQFICLDMNLVLTVLNHFPLDFWKVWLGRRRLSCFGWYSACEEVYMEAEGGKNKDATFHRTTYLDQLVKAAPVDLLYDSFCSITSKIKFTEEAKWTRDYSGFKWDGDGGWKDKLDILLTNVT